MVNKTYIYNLLLSSYFINYNKDEYVCSLDMEQGLALYLFTYSKELFLLQKQRLTNPSIIIDDYGFLNISSYLVSKLSNVNSIQRHENLITFNYLNLYNYKIMHRTYAIKQNTIYNNIPVDFTYNGISFKTPRVDDVISYYFYQYIKYKFNLEFLLYACLLITLYHNSIKHNNILTNLLQYGVSIKRGFKNIKKDMGVINFQIIKGFNIDDQVVQQRVGSLVDFCYDF